MIPVTIVDNFFKDPYSVRNFALSQEFLRSEITAWPGKRSRMLLDVDQDFYNLFVEKVLNLFFNLPRDFVKCNFDMFFQSIPGKYEEGWAHIDFGTTFTGVVYLTPDAPLDAGTSLYVEKIYDPHRDQAIKAKFYSDVDVDINEYRIAREKNNNGFIKTTDISNLFNRLVIFPGNVFHRENKFFGETLDNSRLTLVFFVTLETFNDTLSPIQKSLNNPL